MVFFHRVDLGEEEFYVGERFGTSKKHKRINLEDLAAKVKKKANSSLTLPSFISSVPYTRNDFSPSVVDRN